MLKRFVATSVVLGLAAAAALPVSAQTARREGRLDARSERQEGRMQTRDSLDGEFYGDRIEGRFDDDVDARVRSDDYYLDDRDSWREERWQGDYVDRPARDDYAQQRWEDSGEATLGVRLDPNYERGAMVEQVYRGSPADRAGLRPGDSIIAVNGRRIRSHEQLVRLIGSQRPGDVVELDFVRPTRQSTEARLTASRETSQSVRSPRVAREYGVIEGDFDRDDFDRGRPTTRLRVDDDRDIDEGLIFDRDRDRRRFEAVRPFD